MAKQNFMTLGEFLKERRLKKGLTQKQVSDAFGFTTSQFISNIERGLSPPPANVLRKLVNIYDIPEREILKAIMAEQERFWRNELNLNGKQRSR